VEDLKGEFPICEAHQALSSHDRRQAVSLQESSSHIFIFLFVDMRISVYITVREMYSIQELL
jgi:hypothetical protein